MKRFSEKVEGRYWESQRGVPICSKQKNGLLYNICFFGNEKVFRIFDANTQERVEIEDQQIVTSFFKEADQPCAEYLNEGNHRIRYLTEIAIYKLTDFREIPFSRDSDLYKAMVSAASDEADLEQAFSGPGM